MTGVPVGWRESRVDRVASVRARIGWKALTAAEYQEDGFIFLSTPNIKGRRIDFDNVNYITEPRFLESPDLILEVGDVLLAKDGSTLGITALVDWLPAPATVNGSIAVIRPRDIDPAFLRYVLASDATQDKIGAVKDGMGVPHLFQWDIRRLVVPLPPIAEQRRIADFLDDQTTRIDQVITAREQQINLLHHVGRASRAAAVRGLDMEGVEAVDHGGWLGPVASSFDIRRIGSLATVHAGAGFPHEHQGRGTGDLPFLKVSDLAAADERGVVAQATNFVDVGIAHRLGARPAPIHTILFPKVGAALHTNRRAILGVGAVYDNNVMGLRFRGAATRYMFHVMSVLDLGEFSNPGPVPSVNESTVKDIHVPIPAENDQVRIAADLDALLGHLGIGVAGLRASIALLQEFRRSLITTAVSGEFDVSAASGREVPV